MEKPGFPLRALVERVERVEPLELTVRAATGHGAPTVLSRFAAGAVSGEYGSGFLTREEAR